MLHLFRSNGIRFYEGTGANLSFRNRKYALQTIADIRIHACYRQPIDFSNISRVQAWSNSAVTLEFFSPTNVLLATVAMPFSHVMGSYNIYNYTINWAAISGLVDGSYLKVSNQSSEVWYSEAIEQAKSPLLKIQYSCNRDSSIYGSFKKCFEQIFYAPAALADYDRIEKQTTYLDSRIVNHVISHTSIPVAKLYTDSIPYYMHEILRDSLCHDVIVIDNLAWQKTDEGYKTNHNLQSSIHSAECLLREASTAILRVASQRNLNAGSAPILQPETNILVASFTINWLDADGDSYDVQLSTSSSFATILVSVNITGLSYTFSGLTPNTQYYYRVRSLSCAGTSPWSNDSAKTAIQQATGLRFNGQNHYLNLGNQLNTLPTMPNDVLSFSFLFMPLAYNQVVNFLLSMHDVVFPDYLRSYRLEYSATSIVATLWKDPNTVIGFAVNYNFNINEKYHVVFCKRNNISGYFTINGQKYEANITNIGVSISDDTQAYTNSAIGSLIYDPYYSYSNQIIFDAKIYSQIIPDSAIIADYNSKGDVAFMPNLFAWYRFNERIGTIIADHSPNNRNATMVNYQPQEYNYGSSNCHVTYDGDAILN